MDLDAYLHRIGVPDARTADLATLRRIVYGHATTIAFENLDPFLGREVSVEPTALSAKLVEGRRGGWCFEHNGLLRAALDQLGYATTGLAARVLWGRPEGAAATSRGHMLVRVDLPEGPHLADVGFGGLTLTGVMALVPDAVQETPHEPFRLQEAPRDAGGGAGFVMEALAAGAWRPLYRFDLSEQLPVDYALTSWYLAHHPESHFRHGIMVARPGDGVRHALGGHVLTVHHLDGPSERTELPTPATVIDVLEETFGLATADLGGLETSLKRLF
jgi:arylamine N-acetyltransferase